MKTWMVFAGGGAFGAVVAALVMASAAQSDTAEAGRIAALEARIATLERAVVTDGLQVVTLNGDKELRIQGDDHLTGVIAKDTTVTTGKRLVLRAGDEIIISTGKAQLRMRKSGEIDLSGTDITIDGSGTINVKSSKDVTVKGKKIGQN